MEDQHYAKMETSSSVVSPPAHPRRPVRLYPIHRRAESQDSDDGPQPPSAPPPPPELGAIWGVVPPPPPPNSPPPAYAHPGKDAGERGRNDGASPQQRASARDALADEDERVMEDIALNNSFGADAAAPPPRPPRAAESARNRRDSSPDARDSQHSERSQGKSACCAAGCCGDFSEPDAVGPMAKPRKCRDIFCLLLLLLVWAGWIVMLWVTATEGCPDNCNDPRKLVFGTDSETGEVCGTGAQAGKFRVYYAFPANPLSRRFCVEECPSAFSDDMARSKELGLYEGDPAEIKSKAHNCLLSTALLSPGAAAASSSSSSWRPWKRRRGGRGARWW
mmetsp:Transcript_47270/g.111487  ORF Transcript_47270/g.111487 Transcript_47270/m.111487 type:complete len:335 (-) Transcript_47270:117-1121(-)